MKHTSQIQSSCLVRCLLLATFCAASAVPLHSQSITWSIVNAAGFEDGPDASIRWTMGEAVTAEVSGAAGTMRVGFLPFAFIDQVSSASQALNPDIEISIMPNPASHEILLQVPGDQQHLVRILSLDGRSKLAAEVTSETRIDLRGLPAGPYTLYVIDPTGAFNTKTFIKS